MTTDPSRQRWPPFALVAVYAAGVAARFAAALCILNPLVSSDELVYRNMAYSFFRTGSFYQSSHRVHASLLPNVLYSWMVSPCFFLGDHFFAAARLINSMVLHLSLFAVYAIAREFMEARKAFLAVVITALLPAFSCPMFFMTESLVYPAFLFAFYFTYKAMTTPGAGWRVASGASLAVAMLAKPGFALLIAAAAIVYAALLVHAISTRNGLQVRLALASFTAVAASGLGAFVALSFAYKGGVDYGLGTYQIFTAVQSATAGTSWSGLLLNATAHATILLFAWFIPAGVCVLAMAGSPRGDARLFVFLAFTFTTLVVYIAGVLRLTAVMAFQEHFLRLHGRYYSMIFPLLVVGFMAGCERVPWGPRVRACAAALCAAVATLNIFLVFPRYVESGLLIVDYPDLAWHLAWPALAPAFGAVTLLLTLRTRMTPGPVLALIAAISLVADAGEVRMAIHFDRINSAQVEPAKRLMRSRIPSYETHVAMVDSVNLCRFVTAFWYPYHYTAAFDLPAGSAVDRSRIPADTQFIVACDDYRFDFPIKEEAREGSVRIYSIPPAN